MAADYIEILANEVITVELDNITLTPLLVGITGQQGRVYEFNNGTASVDASAFDHLYVVVINTDQAKDENACKFSEYSLSVSAGGQPQEAVEMLNATNFFPLEKEAPSEWIPAYLPEGYAYVHTLTQDATEYGDLMIYYAPGGGSITKIDFYGPSEEENIFIYFSDSPYTTLDEWLAEAGFEPYAEDWYEINGIPVIIEDFSEDIPISVTTFIKDGLFVVVDGAITVDEMYKVVESLLK